jgi:hypothetical protein
VVVNDAVAIEQFDEVPGNALQVHDWIFWARRTFVIRAIAPGIGDRDVAWLALSEILPGYIKEGEMTLPIILSKGNYRRARR